MSKKKIGFVACLALVCAAALSLSVFAACSNDNSDDTDTPSTTHTWDDGTVTTEPTCTTDGVMTYTCTDEGCTETKTEVIPATGHSMNAGTPQMDGSTVYTCSVCGETTTTAAQYTHATTEITEGGYVASFETPFGTMIYTINYDGNDCKGEVPAYTALNQDLTVSFGDDGKTASFTFGEGNPTWTLTPVIIKDEIVAIIATSDGQALPGPYVSYVEGVAFVYTSTETITLYSTYTDYAVIAIYAEDQGDETTYNFSVGFSGMRFDGTAVFADGWTTVTVSAGQISNQTGTLVLDDDTGEVISIVFSGESGSQFLVSSEVVFTVTGATAED